MWVLGNACAETSGASGAPCGPAHRLNADHAPLDENPGGCSGGPARMPQSIARERFIHHNHVIVIIMTRLASTGLAAVAPACRPARIVLSTLVGLLSLLVVIGLPTEGSALGGIPQARGAVTFEQRPDTDPLASVRVGHAVLDLDEVANFGRVSAIMPGLDRARTSSLPRPISDRNTAAAERGQPERPPRV
ncbi:hypothetical protein [Methylobacterium sp. AMS5]|uniref:hypothetical protein n=1 Tax=Methylobacterium sp. AMS5 TaxID=925818 RepID=UPI0025706F19|nr:hypothetical protein [Methylobacterium sp. AMS5]